jgi:hypothetical protein
MRKQLVGRLLVWGTVAMVIGAVILGAMAVWHWAFGEHITASVQSVSPDGMFRCTLTEWWGEGTIQAKVVIEKRNQRNLYLIASPENDREIWEDVKREPLPVDDSAGRSNYSIVWEYDGKHRTTGLTIFGDYGTPPFPGETIFRMPLASGP